MSIYISDAWNNDQLLDGFRAQLFALNRSPRTIKCYLCTLRRYISHITDRGVPSASLAGRDDIAEYQGHLLGFVGRSVLSVDSYMRAIRVFYSFLLNHGIIETNPAKQVPLPKMPKRLPRNVLTRAEARRLLSAPNTDEDEGLLHRAILELLYSAGIRLSELCSLRVRDVDTVSGFVRVINGKGGKDRMTPIGNTTCLWVRAYRGIVRPKLTCSDSCDHLFLGSGRGRPINPIIIQQFVRRYAKQARISKKVSPHVLRATCATHLLMNGMTLMEVRNMLGHRLLSTTEVYARLTPKDLIRAHRKCHPMEEIQQGRRDDR